MQNTECGVGLDVSAMEEMGVDLDQYLGLWAVDEGRFLLLFEQAMGLAAGGNLAAHVQARRGDGSVAAAKVGRREVDKQAIAVIEIRGTLTKRGSSLSSAGSMVRIRQAVRQAARDDEIGGILLVIDSPGGTIAGTPDLAREVAAATKSKPVWAMVEDLTASAAYWVASQADKIFASERTALVGSIGTYMALYDVSQYAAARGIKPVVIRAGEFKGAGIPGTEITPAQKDVWQGIVDKIQAEFSAGVAAGRRMTPAKVAELADGRVHVAEDARELGLIDGIQTFDDTLAQLGERAASRSKTFNRTRSQKIMAKDNEAAVDAEVLGVPVATLKSSGPQAATYEQLATAIPKADNDFVVSQLKGKATVEQAVTAWTAELQNRLEAKDQQIADAKAAAASPGLKKALGTGHGEPEAGGAEWDDPVAEFSERMRKEMAAGKSRSQAMRSVVKGDRRLHEAMLRATNKPHARVQELIGERFEL